MKKIIFVLPVVVLIAFVVFLVARKQPEPVLSPINESSETSTVANVSIKNFAFHSSEIKIKVGGKVIWTNQDVAPHSVEINGTAKSTKLSKSDSFEFVFNKVGEYDYVCGIHPSMKGKIVVTE